MKDSTLEYFVEKVQQAIRIKTNMIVQFNPVIYNLRDKNPLNREKNLKFLSENIKREKRIAEILERGCKKCRIYLKHITTKENMDILTEVGKILFEHVEEILELYGEIYVKKSERRIKIQSAYLNSRNSIQRVHYLRLLKKRWRVELKVFLKILKLLQEKEVTQSVKFWEEIHDSFSKLPKKVRSEIKKFKSIPKSERSSQLTEAFVMNNVWAIVVANPLAALVLLLGHNMDDAAKWALVAVVWNVSGPIARLIHLIKFSKELNDFANLEKMLEKL